MSWDVTVDMDMCPYKNDDVECLCGWSANSPPKKCSQENCEKIHLTFYNTYKTEIGMFFKGKNYYQDRTKGHIWVAEHEHYHTLTVEPLEGGQYEIAVRFKKDKGAHKEVDSDWAGYFVGPYYMIGINTSGH